MSRKRSFKISAFLNKVLTLILKFEFYLVKIGVNFPFGGSLVIVAKKI